AGRGDTAVRSVQPQPVLLHQPAAQPDQGALLAALRVLPVAEAAGGGALQVARAHGADEKRYGAAAGREPERGAVPVAARRARPEALEAASGAGVSQRPVKTSAV